MISLITTPTAAMAIGALLGLVTMIYLIAFLVAKELSSAGEGLTLKAFAQRLDLAIIPLLFVFALIVTMKVLEVLY